MEVEVPEHGIHSWRDFFVHMATVCLGLLIALGLEQVVEAAHRRHERTELRERLHVEAESDRQSIESNFMYIDAYLGWICATSQDVNNVAAAKKPLVFRPLPVYVPGHPDIPLYPDFPDVGAWESAKENGLLVLLSPEQQAQYTYLYLVESQVMQSWERFDSSLAALRIFWYRYSVAGSGKPPDFSKMTDQDAVEYRKLLAETFEDAKRFRRALNFYAVANRAAISGTKDWVSVIGPLMEETKRMHPDKFPGLEDTSVNAGNIGVAP
jgi:hypothetical protein